MTSEVIEKRSMFHVLGDDVDGTMLRAHPVQLHQIRMLQFTVAREKIAENRWRLDSANLTLTSVDS